MKISKKNIYIHKSFSSSQFVLRTFGSSGCHRIIAFHNKNHIYGYIVIKWRYFGIKSRKTLTGESHQFGTASCWNSSTILRRFHLVLEMFEIRRNRSWTKPFKSETLDLSFLLYFRVLQFNTEVPKILFIIWTLPSR